MKYTQTVSHYTDNKLTDYIEEPVSDIDMDTYAGYIGLLKQNGFTARWDENNNLIMTGYNSGRKYRTAIKITFE